MCALYWQPALPTAEEAYNFCMQVWESDSEKDETIEQEKPVEGTETAAAAAAVGEDAALADEDADETAEVLHVQWSLALNGFSAVGLCNVYNELALLESSIKNSVLLTGIFSKQ